MENTTQEIAVVEPQNTQMSPLGSEKPEDVVSRATHIANVLAPIISQKGLFKSISGRNHIMAEGWATLMGLINVDPIVEYCRRLDRSDELAYEARVVLMKNGQMIASAETIASDKEKASWSRSEQGIKSMAQTRALGKACRLKYSWIVVLAGYDATPAEEMPEAPRVVMPQPKPSTKAVEGEEVKPSDGMTNYFITEKQQKFLFAKWRSAGYEAEDLKKHIQATYKKEHTKELTKLELDQILKGIKENEVQR